MRTFFVILFCFLSIPAICKELNVWNVIEIESGILNRHVLNDLPGSIVALIPSVDGKETPTILGQKVLKNPDKLPKLIAKPTELVSHIVTKNTAGNVGYLSFVSATMDDKDEVKFSVVETSYCSILDKDVNWADFLARVTKIRNDYPNLPSGTKFGVIRVASVITINHQVFTQVKKASKISGWGFSGGSKYLSQKTDSSVSFKVGVALSYSDLDMSSIFPKTWPKRNPKITSNINNEIRLRLEDIQNLKLRYNLKRPAILFEKSMFK